MKNLLFKNIEALSKISPITESRLESYETDCPETTANKKKLYAI